MLDQQGPKNSYKILIAEDDLTLLRGMEMNFRNEGYDVLKATTGEAAVNLAIQHHPHVILLDQMLADGTGLEVCRQLRLRGLESVIIFVTVKGQEVDKVVGLEVGADDYVTKPFSIRELQARVRAHLRRQPGRTAEVLPVYRFGDVEVDMQACSARRKGRDMDLTGKEFELLKMLITCRGEVLSRDRILNAVWGYDASPTTRTVDTHILKLRQKLEPDPGNPRYILSVYGEGYKFVG